MGAEPANGLSRPARAVRSSAPEVARRAVFSVGFKLASATIALVLVFTAVVYGNLSGYQRDRLLEAKQMSALAVTRLFADSCAAPIVFGDTVAISEALQRLAKSDDIPYAAVWSSDGSGRIDQRLAEFGQADHVEIQAIPTALDVRREPERLVLRAPVNDVEGKPVGVAVVTFSLLRENAVIAQVQINTLYASAGIAAALTLLLLIIARSAIVRPLSELVVAANALERGEVSDIEVRSRDEIGQLASAFRSMAHAIASREERIVARNRDMRLVLDNVGQGFLTLDVQARMSRERSRVVEEWFGAPAPDATFGEYLARIDRKAAERFDVAWMLITDGTLPPELSLDHLPRLVHSEAQVFELAYRPITRDDRLEQMVVVISDVTARLERERAQVMERETMSIFKRILSDRIVFEEFFEEASLLVSAICNSDGSDRPGLQRAVHTLKGSAAVYGLEDVADLCHRIESELEGARESVVSEDRKRQLEAAWARVARIRAEFSADPGITVGREEHRALCRALEARGLADLAGWLASWKFEPAARRLELIAREIKLLSQRLGKGDVDVVVEPTDLRLPAKVWAPFWTVSSHMVRNAVDHGLEIPARRAELGKPERATVTLSLSRSEGELVWTLRDDGRGIDWNAIAERARARGLPAASRADLEAALFAVGVSSRQVVTSTSGRGVGLSAVREVVNALGGRIEVWSEVGRGAAFSVHLPASMLSEEHAARPDRASASPGAVVTRRPRRSVEIG